MLDMTVAIATPATPKWNTITKIRFRQIFKIPDAIRQYNGRLVSPMLRSMAAPKL